MKNAIVLCSGGLDSTICAYYIKNKWKYKSITILFFNYQQRALNQERKYAKECAMELGTEFLEIFLPGLNRLSASLINNKNAKIVEIKDLKDTSKENEKWYVPCRNLIFLSYALALAESRFIKNKIKTDIFVGFKCEGKEHYSDTTEEFVRDINKLASTTHLKGIKIKAPLIKKDKEDIILIGKKLGVDFRKTFSCYAGGELHCGKCLACKLRKQGFYWADVKDSTYYKN